MNVRTPSLVLIAVILFVLLGMWWVRCRDPPATQNEPFRSSPDKNRVPSRFTIRNAARNCYVKLGEAPADFPGYVPVANKNEALGSPFVCTPGRKGAAIFTSTNQDMLQYVGRVDNE